MELREHYLRLQKIEMERDWQNRLLADKRPKVKKKQKREVQPHSTTVWANVAFWSDKL